MFTNQQIKQNKNSFSSLQNNIINRDATLKTALFCMFGNARSHSHSLQIHFFKVFLNHLREF